MTALPTLTIGWDDHKRPFTLPAGIITHTMAILAKKGAGKTYTAGVIEEEFAKAELPFVVLDPVGVHYGIRSTKKGREPSPFPVVVFGGEHGDVPIERGMGAAVAQAVVEENFSCVIDLTELSKSAWREFVRDFCRELYRVNRTPRHVFIEEATEFVPQTRRPELNEAYEAVERLMRLGRNRGLGCTLISQRSAQVAKDVLTQIDILIALRTVGPQDRKALLDMFETVLEEDQLAYLEEFKRTIVRLPDGTAWVWSPEFLGCFTQVSIRERETYHAGATPGFAGVKVVQARPDVSALRIRLGAARAEEVGRGKALPEASARVRDLEERCRQLTEKNKELDEGIRRLEEVQAQTQADFQRAVAAAATAQKARESLVAFLGVDGGVVQTNAPPLDREALIEEVLARVPAGRQAVQVAPPEALRKKYQETAVGRLLTRIDALDGDARMAMEYLLGQDAFRSLNRTSVALYGNDAGSSRERAQKALKQLVPAGLVMMGGTGRREYKANVRGCVEQELAAHTPNPDEVEAVVQNVLHRLTA